MRQCPALRVFGIAQQGRCRRVCFLQVFSIPGSQRGNLELLQQAARTERGIKLPGRAGRDGAAHGFDVLQALLKSTAGIDVVKHLTGCNAGQPGFQVVIGCMRQVNLALRHAQPRQSTGVALALVCALVHSQQNGFGFVAQQLGVGQRAGRNNTHHLAFYRPLACGHIANLLTNRYRFPELDELGQIALKRMKRHPRHLDRLTIRRPAFGQRDTQQPRCLFSICKKHLVEVSHAVKHKCVGVVCFDTKVLLHHRRVAREILGDVLRFPLGSACFLIVFRG